jgi:hypothetical protein
MDQVKVRFGIYSGDDRQIYCGRFSSLGRQLYTRS